MVKCSECGFLALRMRGDPSYAPSLSEALEEHRDAGHITQRNTYHPKPVCFMRMPWFREELGKIPITVEDFRPVIHADQSCNQFTEWRQGFSPKEHREMIDRRWERKWRIIEMALIGVLVPLFIIMATIAGAFIERGSWFVDRPSVPVTPAPSIPDRGDSPSQ